MESFEIDQRLDGIEKNLFSIKLQSKEILTLEEAAEYMGMKKSYLYKLTSSNKFKFFSPLGKLIYFLKEDINDFLLQNPNKTISSIEDDVQDFWSKK